MLINIVKDMSKIRHRYVITTKNVKTKKKEKQKNKKTRTFSGTLDPSIKSLNLFSLLFFLNLHTQLNLN